MMDTDEQKKLEDPGPGPVRGQEAGRILYVVHSFPPHHWRGTEVYAMELSQAMRSLGWDAQVFHLVHDPEARGVSIKEGRFKEAPVHAASMNVDPSDPETYFFHPGQDRIFKQLIDRLRPDTVHFLYFAGGLSLNLARTAAQSGPRVVMTVTDFSGLCPRGQMLDRQGSRCPGPRAGLRCLPCLFDMKVFVNSPRLDRVLREYAPLWLAPARPGQELDLVRKRLYAVKEAFLSAALVIYPNENTRRLHHYAGIRGRAERVMDYGIDTTPFRRHKKAGANPPRIAFVGQLLPHKGLHFLAEALDRMPLSYKLLVYGSLDDPGAREYYESLPLKDKNAELMGTFKFENMNKVLQGTDVLVVPSNWDENCPLIVKYGMATGTAMVLADLPGMVAKREGLERVEFFKAGDPADLRRALIRAVAGVRKGSAEAKGPALEAALERGLVTDIKDQARELAGLYEAAD